MEAETSHSEESRLRQAISAAQAYAADEVSVDTVLQRVADGSSQAWSFSGFIVVTDVVVYELSKRLRISYCSGEMTEETTKEALAVLESFAKSLDLSGIEIYGRQGWVKRLKPYGYEQQYAVVIKRI